MNSATSLTAGLTGGVAEGLTVVVTRPQPQADAWVARLQALGQPALALQLLRIEVDASFAPAVAQVWRDLPTCSLLMFVSPNAVLSFFDQRPEGATWPPGLLAAATGPGTVAALQAAGVPAASVLAPPVDAPRFDAEALWAHQLQQRDWAGHQVVIVRGEQGRDWLADTLRQAGAAVQCLAAYRQQPPAWPAAAQQVLGKVLGQPGAFVWLFSSSSAIHHLVDHLHGLGRLAEGLAVPVLATHPRIGQTAQTLGFAQVHPVTPEPASIARLCAGDARGAPIESARLHE